MLESPAEKLKRRTYNVTAMSFTPSEIVEAVRKHVPDLKATYNVDERQGIGESKHVPDLKTTYNVDERQGIGESRPEGVLQCRRETGHG